MNQDETKSANTNYVYQMVILKDTEVTEWETKGLVQSVKGLPVNIF